MKLERMLSDAEWDAPFFKVLAHNDTGRATGHQGGMVLPKELRQFLPTLDESLTTGVSPTVDRNLRAVMFLADAPVADCAVRYQLQTWGGTRSAESRITDGLGPLRHLAAGGDLLLFQRRADTLNHFRLILVKQGTQEYVRLSVAVAGRRWGALFDRELPVTQAQILRARAELDGLATLPFQVTRAHVPRAETRQTRIARSSAFRERVRQEYDSRCAVSGITIATPTRLFEVESAHVVPISEAGSEDIRNGLTLAQSIHWAFDRGLLGVMPDRTITIPRSVGRMPENAFLCQFDRRPITEA
jgi:putative restriction endonuclease